MEQNIKNPFFAEVCQKLGFGCMRLPMKDGRVDDEEFTRMVDAFLADGFNYFDTAHGYLSGESEKAIRRCLTSRYPRERYILTDKLTGPYFDRQADIRPFFEQQLEACGVTYFDFYLMHAQNKDIFEKFKRCRAYETALELKAEGKIRHFGISFHDSAEVLEQILREYPQIEVVQLQFNYVDYESPSVQSRRCYEMCVKYGKPVIVMEPVKGGSLANLPEDAEQVLQNLGGGSSASYAVRFAAGFDQMLVVLSGMSSLQQLTDNTSYMKDFQPLNQRERAAVDQVRRIFLEKKLIPCTACRYCTDGCPKQISIPDLFACYNAKTSYQDWSQDELYHKVHTAHNGRASDCVKCGKCEQICPQHLEIRKLLETVAKEFET